MRIVVDERWLSIPSWEGFYDVSDCGRVRSLDRISITRSGITRRLRGKLLQPGTQKGGYRYVNLFRSGAELPKVELVHRLVLSAFVGLCPPGQEACHGPDGVTSNFLTNLRWDTRS